MQIQADVDGQLGAHEDPSCAIGWPSGPRDRGGETSFRLVHRNGTCSPVRRGGHPMDPVKLVKQQHREVEALFKRVGKAEDAEERRRLMEEIGQKLALHTKIEEEIFYPALREAPTKKAEEMVLEAYEEHHVVKLVLADLPNV